MMVRPEAAVLGMAHLSEDRLHMRGMEEGRLNRPQARAQQAKDSSSSSSSRQAQQVQVNETSETV
jgi:hypothetical protein